MAEPALRRAAEVQTAASVRPATPHRQGGIAGVPAHLRQLEVYAAFFFLEYKIKPEETEIELRIYQNDDIVIGNPTTKDIKPIMNKIILFDKKAEKLKLEE